VLQRLTKCRIIIIIIVIRSNWGRAEFFRPDFKVKLGTEGQHLSTFPTR